jgi:flagella basal body P-ring formation protein FlgA
VQRFWTQILVAAAVLAGASHAGAVVLDARALALAAEDVARAAIGAGADVEVACGPVPALGVLQGQEVEIRGHVLGTRHGSGPTLVSLEIWRDGARIGERSVSVQLHVYRQVLVAAAPIGRGTAALPEQFAVERREAIAGGDTAVASVESVRGMRLRHSFTAGETVHTSDLEPLPVIRRGDKVMATVGVGGITVTVSGIALDDGAVGQRVGIKNDRSGRRLQATVMGPGSVRIELDDNAIGG